MENYVGKGERKEKDEGMVTIKTKEAAKTLGVSPKTIRHWIKYFKLNCSVNSLGHYVMDGDAMKKLGLINNQVKSGKKLDEVDMGLQGEKKQASPVMVSSSQLDERFNKLLFQIDQLDKKIQSKASEVVEYQMLQHRKEIDEITETMERFEMRLAKLEESVKSKSHELIIEHKHSRMETTKKSRLANIFSF
ncbi:MAG: MerR family transcriptional regulator [Bacillus sp. (in: Bacteria)]|nr:MerR family transcriptional regulator [Bacillus sp. (in: firmicutes)]